MVETLIAMTMVTIILGFSVASFGRLQTRQEVGRARDTMLVMAMRARTAAAESGTVARLEIDPAGDSARIYTAAREIEKVKYRTGDFKADMTTSTGNMITVCYSPRGWALPACTTINSDATVTFTLGAYSSQARVRPLGQVERL